MHRHHQQGGFQTFVAYRFDKLHPTHAFEGQINDTDIRANFANQAHTFIGTAEVNAATAKMRLVQIAEEIISILASDAQSSVKVSVEITAEFPDGVSDQIKRAVSENATSLGFKNKTWE